jgi:archaellum component FlaC
MRYSQHENLNHQVEAKRHDMQMMQSIRLIIHRLDERLDRLENRLNDVDDDLSKARVKLNNIQNDLAEIKAILQPPPPPL